MNDHDVTGRMPDAIRLQALMVSYQAGALDAFDQLYGLLSPSIRDFLRRRAATPEQIDDLVQETFLQIHRARHTYNPAYPVAPWAIAIARHVWLMHCRAAGRRPQPSASVDELSIGRRGEAEAYADRELVRRAVAALSPDRRRPLVWHHVIGLSFREIARRLGIREDSAKLRSSRGMADLRARLSPKASGSKDRRG